MSYNKEVFNRSIALAKKQREIENAQKYQVNVYHGGEMPDETYQVFSMPIARVMAKRGEHAEIIDLKSGTLVE